MQHYINDIHKTLPRFPFQFHLVVCNSSGSMVKLKIPVKECQQSEPVEVQANPEVGQEP